MGQECPNLVATWYLRGPPDRTEIRLQQENAFVGRRCRGVRTNRVPTIILLDASAGSTLLQR